MSDADFARLYGPGTRAPDWMAGLDGGDADRHQDDARERGRRRRERFAPNRAGTHAAELEESRERVRELEDALRAVAFIQPSGRLCWCESAHVMAYHDGPCEEAARLVGREVPDQETAPAAVPLPSSFPTAVECPSCGHRGEPGGYYGGHYICDHCGEPLDAKGGA